MQRLITLQSAESKQLKVLKVSNCAYSVLDRGVYIDSPFLGSGNASEVGMGGLEESEEECCEMLYCRQHGCCMHEVTAGYGYFVHRTCIRSSQ